MAAEAKLLTVQFLAWVAARPRAHADVVEAWRSTCPLNCAWEDAITDELVAFDSARQLVLTPRGRALLAAANAPPPHAWPLSEAAE